MDLGSIFLVIALLILVAIFIGRPFLDHRKSREEFKVSSNDHKRSTLLAEKDRILNAVHELDFDFALGKIPDDDYPNQRSLLVERGSKLLKILDNLEMDNQNAESLDDLIENEISLRREQKVPQKSRMKYEVANINQQTGSSGLISVTDEEVELILAKRRRERREKSGGFCPKCGNPIQKNDRFCPKCGEGLIKS